MPSKPLHSTPQPVKPERFKVCYDQITMKNVFPLVSFFIKRSYLVNSNDFSSWQIHHSVVNINSLFSREQCDEHQYRYDGYCHLAQRRKRPGQPVWVPCLLRLCPPTHPAVPRRSPGLLQLSAQADLLPHLPRSTRRQHSEPGNGESGLHSAVPL